MRNGAAQPTGTPARAPQRQSITPSELIPGPSSLPFRGLPSAKDNSQQKDQQRRGPARQGRIMQTVEKPPEEFLNARNQPRNGPSSSHLRPATPGPSSRRTAPPQPSPGISATPRAVSVMPCPVPGSQDSPKSVSRSRGKRTFHEMEDTDSSSKAEEWERMLERFKSHEKEMEQQRAQLEDTKRLLAEQKTRIDDLEQRRRAEELLRNPDMGTRTEERDVAPPHEAVPRDLDPPPVTVARDGATPAVAVPRDVAPPPLMPKLLLPVVFLVAKLKEGRNEDDAMPPR
ncbi:hypothetical protein INS49_013942 [Diaporthe citri]|uniref:uncharacterized protein n=1 Tax=Diaporthe citri TaxID=83186 RepID=UPI001C803E08|nr:uncharacterized protein INS49_013942 [Diaporthe citri]KAG6358058.1 hypothetical protein INS49_013942 [Diaporthe citri]